MESQQRYLYFKPLIDSHYLDNQVIACILTSKIDALPAIVNQVKGRCEVYVDGGITQGTDILKALAIGAQMVS